MGEIVNLNRARKSRAKAAAKAEAVANRAVHGRSKPDRTQAEAEKARIDSTLDGAKREAPSDDV